MGSQKKYKVGPSVPKYLYRLFSQTYWNPLGTALKGHQALWKSHFKCQITVLDSKAIYKQWQFWFLFVQFLKIPLIFFPLPVFHLISNSLSLMPPLPDYTLSSPDLLDAHKKRGRRIGINEYRLHGFHPSVKAWGQLGRHPPMDKMF